MRLSNEVKIYFCVPPSLKGEFIEETKGTQAYGMTVGARGHFRGDEAFFHEGLLRLVDEKKKPVFDNKIGFCFFVEEGSGLSRYIGEANSSEMEGIMEGISVWVNFATLASMKSVTGTAADFMARWREKMAPKLMEEQQTASAVEWAKSKTKKKEDFGKYRDILVKSKKIPSYCEFEDIRDYVR